MGEFNKSQEILIKIGTEIFKIDKEMTEKNEAEDGNSISLTSTSNPFLCAADFFLRHTMSYVAFR